MKNIFLLFIAFTISTIGFSQNLQISSSASTSVELSSIYNGSEIEIVENNIVLSSALYKLGDNDPSFKVYPLQNGAYIVRENIAGFVLFDSFGSLVRPISNSSNSTDGEKISELAMDPLGKTVVLYNPQIRIGGKRGSQAKIVGLEDSDITVFYKEDEEISAVRVAESGEFIAIAYGKGTKKNDVVVIDKFGNEIKSFAFDRVVTGLNLYGSGSTLTVFSENRVAVFNVLSGERIASSSFRNGTLRFANYSGADQAIVGVTGDLNGNTLSNIEVRIINVAAKKIITQSYSGEVEVTDFDAITLNRNGRFKYTISGMSKDLNLKATF